MRDIGQALQARAKELGLTDSEVARRLGLAQARYSKYVNGIREPDFATFGRICRELSITPNEVLGFDSKLESDDAAARRSLNAIIDGLDPDRLDLVVAIVRVVSQQPSPRTGPRSQRISRDAGTSKRSAEGRKSKSGATDL